MAGSTVLATPESNQEAIDIIKYFFGILSELKPSLDTPKNLGISWELNSLIGIRHHAIKDSLLLFGNHL